MEQQSRNCVICRRPLYTRRYQQHVLTDDLSRTRPDFTAYLQEHAVLEIVFDGTRRVCHRCWQSAENAVRVSVPVIAEHDVERDVEPNIEPVAVPETVHLQVFEYKRAPNTPQHCLFNGCHNTTRHRIPNSIKTHVFCENKLYIPKGARVCTQHLESNLWNELPERCNVTHDFTAEQFTDLCDMLRNALQRGSRIDFNTRGSLTNEEMHFWTGRKCEEFDEILEQTPSLSSRCREPRTALGIFLAKLRTGEPDERLSTLFNMSRRKLERLLVIVRECLNDEYVGLHLGVDHISRHQLLERNLKIPKILFGDENENVNNKLILVADGTYIYINKSTNFLFQRLSYSLHKYANLLKPFLIVCTDGYILDVMGPYAATKTDAQIMKDIMSNEEDPIHILLQPEDTFILDRGFRDSLSYIDGCGYEAYVPETKDRDESQLTTEQANDTRAVTLCRWVVEVVNGRFKRDFKLFRQKYFNKSLPHMFINFKIAAAITNHFHLPIVDSAHADEFVNIIRQKMDAPNLLHTYVERNRLNYRRVDFQRMDANLVENFSVMAENDIVLLSLGTYQLKLARSYCAEHLSNGLYTIEIYRDQALENLQDYGIDEDAWLLRGRIQSRHVRSKIYYCYILLNRLNNNIIQHYCTCLTGRRTMGTCAHIVSIVWYLGYARHTGFTAPAAFLNDVIIDHDLTF